MLDLIIKGGQVVAPWGVGEWEVQGWPVMTILRGKVAVEDGKLLVGQGYGQQLSRKVDSSILKQPMV